MTGRISMDLMAVDVTDVPVSAVRRDMMATLIGAGLTLDDVATQAGTISYEVLTGLGRRYHRVWKV
jgi:alanine racemase